MLERTPWQKSSYCGQGESCLHIATAPGSTVAVLLTESADPSGAILTTNPTPFRALLTTLKKEPRG